jgi:molybdopterin-guanine dinucleotide biosynthesis protein A
MENGMKTPAQGVNDLCDICDAVILAGGNSSRMGCDKLMLDYCGVPGITRIAARFAAVFDTVILSASRTDQYPMIPLPHIADIFPGRGPMAGLHAALSQTNRRGVFLCAADMPFADPQTAKIIVEAGYESDICVTLDAEGRPEPLFAYYAKSVLPLAEGLIRQGKYSMRHLLKHARTRWMKPEDFGAGWGKHTLKNVNTPEDYDAALESVIAPQ